VVLDANILIRAVLGVRVFFLISQYAKQVALVAPDTAFEEAREKLPAILQKRKVPVAEGLATLESLRASIESLPSTVYSPFEAIARQRLVRRDEDDWPILASALALDCPIWTEDTDFFGCGVATWTSDRIELYFKALAPQTGSADDQ
jgi:predicted nucleic acid-binding protein